MKFTKAHIKRVERRLQEYERVLALPEFERLGECNICDRDGTRPGNSWDSGCVKCLFQDPYYFSEWCSSEHSVGNECETKYEQMRQYKHLLRLLDSNGYEFK